MEKQMKHNILGSMVSLAHHWIKEMKNGNLTVQFVEEEDGEISEIRFYSNETDELVGIIANKYKLN